MRWRVQNGEVMATLSAIHPTSQGSDAALWTLHWLSAHARRDRTAAVNPRMKGAEKRVSFTGSCLVSSVSFSALGPL